MCFEQQKLWHIKITYSERKSQSSVLTGLFSLTSQYCPQQHACQTWRKCHRNWN